MPSSQHPTPSSQPSSSQHSRIPELLLLFAFISSACSIAIFVPSTLFAQDPNDTILQQLEAQVMKEPTAEGWLQLATAQQDRFQLDATLESYHEAVKLDSTSKSAQELATYLLALGRFDEAGAVLNTALSKYGANAELWELRAELSAALEDSEGAVDYIERSWSLGRDRLSWLERSRLAERLHKAPFRALLDPKQLVDDLEDLPTERVWQRLEWLGLAVLPSADPRSVKASSWGNDLLKFLSQSSDPQTLRLGVRVLRRLDETSIGWDQLLAGATPQARRAALFEIHRQLTAGAASGPWLEALQAFVSRERDLGNSDLAQALIALEEARNLDPQQAIERLDVIPGSNTFRHLILEAQATLLEKDGQLDRAAEVRSEAAATDRQVEEAARLEGYWQCQERHDLQQIRTLLEHHRRIEPIDGRIYGLPERDFEDQKNLTIPERLFLRVRAEQAGQPLATSGPMQYHRESRNLLRRLQQRTGGFIDCSGHLQGGEATSEIKALVEDGSEVKLEEDNDADNEVHISVNPYDPRFVVASSNPTGNGGNEVYRSSNWGQTWTNGTANVANNCCDPVSYYNRTEVSGQMRDVLYHSTLVENAAGLRSRVIYSLDNGASWQDCGTSIGSSDRDRQDHAIDTNPASTCYNTIYLAHHNGTQYVAASTGTTFPYCQSWKEASTGIGGTIGSAIVVSTNGRAHNFFTQYGTPGGVYQVTTSNCGDSWGSAQKIADIKNAGAFEWGIPSTCQRQVYRYPQADSDRQSQSAFLNNIYIVWNDLSGNCSAPGCNGNTTCNNDIYLSIGTPNNRNNPTSWTFSTRNLTDGMTDDYTDEFYPSLTVDQADGSIYITYYRSNSGAPGGSGNINPRRRQVHYVMLKSINGGSTFQGPLQITNQPTDESGNGANSAMQWGDYAWNDVIDGVAYGSWTDRREGADEDIWASKICSEPSHWSERAPTFSAPATQANGTGTFTISWTAPDLYWGDGGENAAQRKFQLWVDGQLEIDNLAATTTSTSWTPPDGNAHQVEVRAVNACGVSKNYAATTIQGGGGGGNAAPQVSITAPSNGASFPVGTSVTLSGTATDVEDGNLTNEINWTSNRDGSLGSGASVQRTLSAGSHTITAQVTDSGGRSSTASITVQVEEVCSGGGLDESFEADVSGWTTSGLWHLVQNSSCAPPGYSSASHAMYFGRDGNCDYATGQAVSGDLISPSISGLDASSMLTFSYFRQVENEPGFNVDSTEVAISTDGGSTWNLLWSKDSGEASENAWTTSPAISLAAYANQTVRLRFRFDSDDEIANNFVGFLIDDVKVSSSCTSAPSVLFSDLFELGNLSRWTTSRP